MHPSSLDILELSEGPLPSCEFIPQGTQTLLANKIRETRREDELQVFLSESVENDMT